MASDRDGRLGLTQSSTQSLMPPFMGPESTESLLARPEMKYLPKQMVENWTGQRNKIIDGLRTFCAPVALAAGYLATGEACPAVARRAKAGCFARHFAV